MTDRDEGDTKGERDLLALSQIFAVAEKGLGR